MEFLLESLLDALLDSIKLLPFLYLTYLLIEYLEHRASSRFVGMLSRVGKFGTVGGSLLGLIPQCGFSVAASNLYAGGIITAGTLISVFVSTSDEAVPILLSADVDKKYLIWLIVIKLILALAAGLIVDLIFKRKNEQTDPEAAHELLHSHCGHGCEHHGGIFKSALFHTLTVFAFVIIVMFACNLLVGYIGEQAIASLFSGAPLLAPIIAAIIGFVPNCASSVVLTELFVSGALPFGAMVAGLVTNTGIGLMVLFRSEKQDKKMPYIMAGVLLVVALLGGFAVDMLLKI